MRQSAWVGWVSGGQESRSSPPGCVLTVLRGSDVIVWLIGEVDTNVALDLHDIAEQTPDVASRLVIDGSRVTFCDSTVLRFISSVAAYVPVTIRRPSQVLADILAFSGLTADPRIRTEPGDPQ